MRDLMLFGMSAILLVMALRNGFVAYLLWGWAGLMSVQSYLYGFMASIQYAEVYAIISLAHLLFGKDVERVKLILNRTSILFVVFTVHMSICAYLSTSGHPRNWEITINMLKTVLYCIIMPMQLTSRFRIQVMVLVVAISTAFHGFLDGLKFLVSGGSHFAYGIAKFGDNNHFAMVMIMVVPLLFYLYRYTEKKIIRWMFVGLIPIELFAVVATQSRGALVCLGIISVQFILKSRQKISGLIWLICCSVLIFAFAPQNWKDRMNTIDKAEQDTSMMGRVGAWQISSSVAIKHPFFGGGPHAIEMGSVWNENKYAAGFFENVENIDMVGINADRGRAAHSIYFEVMGDLGFLGFVIFAAILVNAFYTAAQISKISKSYPVRLEWARSLGEMLALSVLAYITAGALLSAAYFELAYTIIILLEVVKIEAIREVDNIKMQTKLMLLKS